MGSPEVNQLSKIVLRLAIAGIISKTVVEAWAEFLHNQGYTPGIVSISVEKAINSGQQYFHLGNLSVICREEKNRLDIDKGIRKEQKDLSGSDRWKGAHFFTLIKDALIQDRPVDMRKALLKANQWGRQNSSHDHGTLWDKSDKEHREAIARLSGIM